MKLQDVVDAIVKSQRIEQPDVRNTVIRLLRDDVLTDVTELRRIAKVINELVAYEDATLD